MSPPIEPTRKTHVPPSPSSMRARRKCGKSDVTRVFSAPSASGWLLQLTTVPSVRPSSPIACIATRVSSITFGSRPSSMRPGVRVLPRTSRAGFSRESASAAASTIACRTLSRYCGSTPEEKRPLPQRPIVSGPSWLCVLATTRTAPGALRLQHLAGLQHVGVEDADEVHGDDRDLLPAVAHRHRAGPQVVVDAGRLAVVVEAGHVDGLRPDRGRDRPLREPEVQRGRRSGRRGLGQGEQEKDGGHRVAAHVGARAYDRPAGGIYTRGRVT